MVVHFEMLIYRQPKRLRRTLLDFKLVIPVLIVLFVTCWKFSPPDPDYCFKKSSCAQSCNESSSKSIKTNSKKRQYSDFAGFLSNSAVDPLILQPFMEEDKRSFAAMENVASFLTKKALSSKYRPLVSVIMAIYNRFDTVGDAVQSVLSQTYDSLELIIVDDASTDGSLKFCQTLEDSRIHVISLQKNAGASAARNAGLQTAHGDYIMYLDSDNRWEQDYVQASIGAFVHLPDADAVYSGQYIYKGKSEKPYAVRFGRLNKSLLYNVNYIDLNVFCHTRAAYERLGGFDAGLNRLGDWDLILRYARRAKMYSVPFLLSHYYKDKANNSITKTADLQGPLQAIRFRHALHTENKKNTQSWIMHQPGILKPLVKNVTVVIANYESLPELLDCIKSLSSPNLSVLLRITVVDNNSSRHVQNTLQRLSDNGTIKAIFNGRNYGFSHAVNQGIQDADKDSDILLLNSDAFVVSGAIEALQDTAYRLPDVGLVVPQQILLGGTKTLQQHVPYANSSHSCDVSLSYHHNNIINPSIFHDGEITELSFAPFFCVYIRRDVLHKAGLLDAEFGRHYRSDRIYSDVVRLIHGLKIYHVGRAQVVHKLQVSTEQLEAISKSEYELMFTNNRWDEETRLAMGYRTASWAL
jgi:GT2 family glycosyltransferase